MSCSSWFLLFFGPFAGTPPRAADVMIGDEQNEKVIGAIKDFSENTPLILFRFKKPQESPGFPPDRYNREFYSRQWVRGSFVMCIFLGGELAEH